MGTVKISNNKEKESERNEENQKNHDDVNNGGIYVWIGKYWISESTGCQPSIDKSVTYNLYKGQVGFGSVWVRNPVTNAKITGLKNSNSKVIEVTASEDASYPHLEIKLVGEGTTKNFISVCRKNSDAENYGKEIQKSV